MSRQRFDRFRVAPDADGRRFEIANGAPGVTTMASIVKTARESERHTMIVPAEPVVTKPIGETAESALASLIWPRLLNVGRLRSRPNG